VSASPAGTAPAPAVASPASPGRVIFIDLARAVAVLLMVQGHTIDALLHPDLRWSLSYNAWLFIRGLTSCTFLFLSGAAFSITAIRHWDQQRTFTWRWFRRVRRFAFFLALGYLIHFPMGRFWHLQFANEERWRSFLTVDILQNTASTLLVLQAFVWVCRTPRTFLWLTASLCVALVFLTPLAYGVDWVRHVPLWLASYMYPGTGSLFPLFPWAGYALAGAAFGVAVAPYSTRDKLPGLELLMFRAGGGLVIASSLLAQLTFEPYSTYDWWRVSPVHFALRLGCVLLLLAGFTWVSLRLRRLATPLQALAEESLLVYAVHVAVLYGSLWNVGLGPRLGWQQPAAVLQWILVLWAAMIALAWTWNWLQHAHPRLAVLSRVTTITSLIYPLARP
jgi:uncharacterized membrane protein